MILFDLTLAPDLPVPTQARRSARRAGRQVSASYDAAQTTDENRKHWRAADGLSAAAANSPQIRQILRNRSRYEMLNGGYYGGIARTYSNEVVGIGPRPQLLTEDRRVNDAVEQLWLSWARKTKFNQKLITQVIAEVVDGESIAVKTTNGGLRHPIKLDLQLVEADRLTDLLIGKTPTPGDGIVYDDWGNPMAYRILRHHPGDMTFAISQFGYDTFSADDVFHMFFAERPGQLRGIPLMMSSLPLFAFLRRFTLATIRAAEVAADQAGVIQSQAPIDDEQEDYEPFDAIELDRGMFTTLPRGYQMSQLKAEHPASTYEMFKGEMIREIARPLNMPYNVAAADSSKYNYASGRLDHAMFDRSVSVHRQRIEDIELEPLFDAFLDEVEAIARTDASFLPGPITTREHEWQWRGRDHSDPTKEASADNIRIMNGTLSIPSYYASRGIDWEAEQEQAAAAIGVPVEKYRELLAQKLFASGIGGQAPQGDGEPADDEQENDDA